MPFIRSEQLAKIVDFVIENYNSPLPSNLDETAKETAKGLYLDKHNLIWMFKAGAKWMAGQGVSMLGNVDIYGVYMESIIEELRKAGFKLGEKVVIQIRKKQ